MIESAAVRACSAWASWASGRERAQFAVADRDLHVSHRDLEVDLSVQQRLAAVPPPFELSNERSSDTSCVVRVTGELDLHTAPRLQQELDALIADGVSRVVVDLAEAPFVDSTGLGVLVAAGQRLGREGFALAGLQIEPRRVLEITGADRLLTIVDPAGEAA
jgi:anti-sigma B factor antagonist